MKAVSGMKLEKYPAKIKQLSCQPVCDFLVGHTWQHKWDLDMNKINDAEECYEVLLHEDEKHIEVRNNDLFLDAALRNKKVRLGKGQGDEWDAAIITNKQMMELQLQTNDLDFKLLKIRCCLGIFRNKKLKPYLKAALTTKNKDLQDFFTVSWVKFMKTSGKKEEYVHQPVIVAKIPALIMYLLDCCGLDPDHHQVQLGIDGGRMSSSSVCLSTRLLMDSSRSHQGSEPST